MEHNHHPGQEEPAVFPEDQPILPADTTPEESAPEILDLSFQPEQTQPEALIFPEPEPEASAQPEAPQAPSAPDLALQEAEDASKSVEDVSKSAVFSPGETPGSAPVAPTFPQSEVPFMERIPDVEEDYPPEVIPSPLSQPEHPRELTADDPAMDSHGMLAHGEEEPPFDLSILDDPELALPEEEPPAEPPLDQAYQESGKEFEQIFQPPKQEEKQPDTHKIARKGRPKRKKGEGFFGIPNILVTFVWLALILAIGVTAGRMLWVCAADVLAFGRENKPVTVTIYEADTMDDIIDKLYDNGLIRYKGLFKLYADISDAEEDIQPGIYDLNTRYDYHALVNFMSPRSSREVIRITIPEGYTCRQIFQLLEENRVCTALDAASYAATGELADYWFLEGVERGTDYCLEGFLFPDTYDFYKNSTPREALEKLLDGFEYRFSEEMRAQIDTLNANVTGGSYTVREITIVASLIEKESAAPSESPNIAGVIYNRLFNWGGNPAYLNIDASIVYAQGGENDTIDTSLDSPYNTYTHTGLTPTPIANPGLASLQAALNPANHNYYYYVLNPSTGMHQFSTTYEEHTAYVNRFAEAQ